MVIKSGKINKQMLIFLSAVTILLPVLFIFRTSWEDARDARITILCCVMWYSLMGSYVLVYWIATGRTIIMRKEGCTVAFLGYRWYYRWDELQMKRFADYDGAIGYGFPFKGGAEFSPKVLRKPKWLNPLEYCQWAHPISFFFVCFRPEVPVSKDSTCWARSDIYVVDEMEFRAKLKEWGVCLSEA